MKKKISLILFSLCLVFSVDAAHIIGGEITYRCLGNGNYEFTMKIYRDCFGGGAQFDSHPLSMTDATVTVFRGGNPNPYLVDGLNTSISLNEPVVTPLSADLSNPCLIPPDDVCVEEGVYVFTLNLPSSPDNYFIVYQRCCRNNTINNIINPGETGATYSIEITPDAQVNSAGQCQNNSPTFNNFPPIIICANEPINFDHSATDTDGDQLVYSFCSPKTGGGTAGTNGNPGFATDLNGVAPDPDAPPAYSNVAFVAGTYSPTNPMGGSPQVIINPITGLITGEPDILGQFVVGVCVEEYRNGQLIGTVRRDFQFNVENCDPTVVADIQNDEVVGDQEYVVNSCGNSTISFINQSYQTQFINTYAWEFDLQNGQLANSTQTNATITFPDIGTYQGTMIVNQGTPCTDTAFINVNIYPEINADFSFDYDTCVAGAVSFTNMSTSGSGNITSNEWNFAGGDLSSDVNPNHQFEFPGDLPVTLFVEDVNGCEDQITQIVEWYPVPPILIIEPSTFDGCAPQDVFFNNLSMPIDSTYDIVWDFGDGTTGSAISPTHLYETPGLYDVSLSVTSPIGCMTSAFFPDWINVEPSPTAAFTFSPNNPTNFQSTVDFMDQSTGAVSWQWDFSGQGFSNNEDPTFTFPDTGLQEITLVVTHPSGCKDTSVQVLDIEPKVNYFLPNAYTPNNDGLNDNFLGRGFFLGMTDFSLNIWNRWGELIFETTDPTEGWNGKKFNTGKASPNGVYVVIVKYKGPRGRDYQLKGFATLIR